MKKILSIFIALAMLFCLSANLFTFAADEPVKDVSQISANETDRKQFSKSTIINVAKIATILTCGAVSSAIAGSYFYEKGYQLGENDNWLSVGNIKMAFGTIVTYWLVSKIGGGIINAISGIGTAITGQGAAVSKAIRSVGVNLGNVVIDQGNDIIEAINRGSENVINVIEDPGLAGLFN